MWLPLARNGRPRRSHRQGTSLRFRSAIGSFAAPLRAQIMHPRLAVGLYTTLEHGYRPNGFGAFATEEVRTSCTGMRCGCSHGRSGSEQHASSTQQSNPTLPYGLTKLRILRFSGECSLARAQVSEGVLGRTQVGPGSARNRFGGFTSLQKTGAHSR
jgi:hypothetical protein